MKNYVITVMALDRVGIIRDVSRALSDAGGNITNISQTVMRGYFTLIFRVQMPDDTPQLLIKQAVERSGAVGEFEVNVRPYVEVPESCRPQCENYMLSVTGTDREGVIAQTTDMLVESGTNVDDLYAYTVEDKFLMLARVSVPIETDVEAIQARLAKLGEETGFQVHFQHENIFRATSDIIPVKRLNEPSGREQK